MDTQARQLITGHWATWLASTNHTTKRCIDCCVRQRKRQRHLLTYADTMPKASKDPARVQKQTQRPTPYASFAARIVQCPSLAQCPPCGVAPHPAQVAAREWLQESLVWLRDQMCAAGNEAQPQDVLRDDAVNEHARRLCVGGQFMVIQTRGLVLCMHSTVQRLLKAGQLQEHASLLLLLREIARAVLQVEVGGTALGLCRAADLLDSAGIAVGSASALSDMPPSQTPEKAAAAGARAPASGAIASVTNPASAPRPVEHVHDATNANTGQYQQPGWPDAAGRLQSSPPTAESAFYAAILSSSRVARYCVAANHLCIAHNGLTLQLRRLHKVFCANRIAIKREDSASFYTALAHFKALTELGKAAGMGASLRRMRTALKLILRESAAPAFCGSAAASGRRA